MILTASHRNAVRRDLVRREYGEAVTTAPAEDIDFLYELLQRFPDKLSRLKGGFYAIKDKTGSRVPFVMNEDQARFLTERHGMDILLKARQLGMTSVVQIDMLDDCLHIDNLAAGVIAHNLVDAKAFFRDKIKFAYDHLPDAFKRLRSADQDSADSLRFSNGSSIRVGVSLRSGTLQRLHVSEYGKLCAKFPERAEEVKSGAFNTVHAGQMITVESTAEGRAGHFFDLSERSRKMRDEGRPLTVLDFKFHFFPWWTDKGYSLDADVIVSKEMSSYFEALRDKHGIELTREQQAWYVKKSEQQGDKMKQEFPSTPDEAFEAAIEGAYFSQQMVRLRKEGRICRIPILDIPVYTSWDLGVNDETAITFWQDVGKERRAIDYYENSGEGFGHYAAVLSGRGYNYSRHYMPHDADHRMLGLTAKSRREYAEEAGIRPVQVVPRIATETAGIDASRAFLPQVWIDEQRCVKLVQCLDSYRKEWDDKLGTWKDRPLHDQFSHGYKSLETAAVIMRAAPSARIDYSRMGKVA